MKFRVTETAKVCTPHKVLRTDIEGKIIKVKKKYVKNFKREMKYKGVVFS